MPQHDGRRARQRKLCYDWLSRLTSEERSIDTVGTYTFNYTYNQASQLKSMTNPFGSITNYVYDAAGAVAEVKGSGEQAPPTAGGKYINSINYKAFGGVKNITYGNTRQLNLQYNNQITSVQSRFK
jgi:YD repeat-containing protein